MRTMLRSSPAPTLAVMILLACSNGNEPEGGLALVGSLPARSNPGWRLEDPVTVRLVDSDGAPRPGVAVHWSIAAGGGSIEPIAAETDADGLVSAVWTLGAAGENAITAGVADGPTETMTIRAEAFRVSALAAGFQLGCGIVDGAIWCWGDDAWTSTEHVAIPADIFGWTLAAPGRVDGPDDFTAIAVSGSVVCGIDDVGDVLCAEESAPLLSPVPLLPPMRSIVGTSAFSGEFCGLASSGSEAWCWKSSSLPAKVPQSPAFTTIDIERSFPAGSAAGILGCGLVSGGAALCWGTGPLGNGTFEPSDVPVAVSGGHSFVEIAVTGSSACGRKSNGEVWCWGRNDQGELGIEGPDAAEPVLSATGVDRIAASQQIVIALRGSSVDRWGGGEWAGPPGPVATLADLDVADFASDGIECVLLADDQAYCYGEMWDRSSAFKASLYEPVHPVVDP
jgi:hypothetical protein